MRIAIIDDLLTDLEYLRSNVCRWADEHAVPLIPGPALFENGETFLEQFQKDRYDIIFLDIFMEGMNGMDTARRIRECDDACRLVFTTTSAEYAVDSNEVDSSYYLVKPYSYEKLSLALDRCSAAFLEQGQFIIVPDRGTDRKLFLHPITWTEYADRRILVHMRDGTTLTVSMNQGEFAEQLLKYPYFCDCMKGILVNFEAVVKLYSDHFLLKDGTLVPISRLKYRNVREQFSDYSLAHARGGY